MFGSRGLSSVLGLRGECLQADATVTNDTAHLLVAIFLGVWFISIQFLVLNLVASSAMCTEDGKRQQNQPDGDGTSRNAGCSQENKEVLREIAATLFCCL